MNIQHLVATMNQIDDNLFNKMNLKCDAIFANQSNKTDYIYKNNGKYEIKMLSTETVGVGINRNLGIMLSSADICILSDDDMIYTDDYVSTILTAFNKLKSADIIIFNLKTVGNDKIRRRINKRIKRVNVLNFMNYGAARIAFKRDSIINNNIWFTTKFGGGATYSSGEDTMFLADALKKGLKIYTYPVEIAIVNQEKSSWFNGYDKKFYYDKGALISQIHPLTKYFFFFIYFPFRFKSKLNYKIKVKCLIGGMKGYKNSLSYENWNKDK